jgi:outer membrane biosynthesis protein TonB
MELPRSGSGGWAAEEGAGEASGTLGRGDRPGSVTGRGRSTVLGTGAGLSPAERRGALASRARAPAPPPALDALLREHYPVRARTAGISGAARAVLRIDAEGRTRVERIESATEPDFGAACASALRRSPRWAPALDAAGDPVATRVRFVCRFDVAP